MAIDVVVFTRALVDKVKAALAPMESRLAALEARPVMSMAEAELRAILLDLQQRAAIPGPAGAQGPQGEKGVDGAPAQAVTREQILSALAADSSLIEAAVSAYLRAHPPAAGKDGRDGIDGKDGARGQQGEKALDGRDGLPGVQGPAGRDGDRGGKGTDGKDGRDGIDGTLEGLSILPLDERSFAFTRADGTRLGVVEMPGVLDAGVYRDGEAYRKGDGVSFGGSFFIAQRDTVIGEKPEDASKAFRLAAKRGRDGREGKQGPTGERGPKGDRGDNGRNFS